MSVYVFNFVETLKKCLIMISPKHIINATITANVVDIIYVGELEIHTALTYHCATYSVWPGPLLIVLYLALTAKPLETSVIYICFEFENKTHVIFQL